MRGRRLCRAALLLVAPVVAGEATARAEPERPLPIESVVELDLAAPAECPDRARMLARVQELVGRTPSTERVVVRVRVSVQQVSPRYSLVLAIGGGANDRTMRGDDCARLVDAAALVVALDVDPDALSRRSDRVEAEREPSPAPTTEPPPSPPPPRRRHPPATPPLAPREPSVTIDVGPRTQLDVGSLPRPALGLALGAIVAHRSFALDLQGTGYFKRFTVDGPRGGDGGAYVALGTFGAQGCFRAPGPAVSWRACAGAEIGRESTRGVNIVRPSSSASVWSALLLSAFGRVWPDRAVSPMLGVTVGHPLSSASVQIQGFGTVFSPSTVFARFVVGADAFFF